MLVCTRILPRTVHVVRRLAYRSLSSVAFEERPLAGIKVVDLTRILAGPLATQMLSDLGADIIKACFVENPKHGDDTRSWTPPGASIRSGAPRPDLPPESAYFLQANRNKRSITLNLRHPKGQEVIRKLVEKADVFVENYLPGKLEQYGLGYEQLRKINPSLVYCSISGYGSTGPYAKNPGYDVAIEAEAGLMHITGERGGRPVKVGVAVTDILTGHYAHSAILAALYKRMRTGRGSQIECSLFESQIASLVNIASNYLIGGLEGERLGTEHASIVPYQVFPTKDSFIMISAGNDGQFAILANKIFDRAQWAVDERFATNSNRVKNRTLLIRMIEERLADRTTAEWVERLTGKGLPFAPINNIAQTFAHPQAIARKVVEEVDHPRAGKIKIPAAAVTYDGVKMKAYRPPPYLGQHTDMVLEELGYTSEETDGLKADGVL